MCQAFAEVLSIDHTSPDDNFFKLGGHSLLAVLLAERLQEKGIPANVRMVFQAPTVASLLDLLDLPSIGDGLGVLLPIRTSGQLPPFFCVHPSIGMSWCYMPMARYVPEDYPLYGLQARGLDGAGELPGSIREMAADYIRQIRAVQASGPYHLVGWSFGGYVAHEIATQLQAAGEQVAALVILDAYPMREGNRRPAPRPVATPGPQGDDARADAMRERIRQERGVVAAAVSESELPKFDRIIRNNAELTHKHEANVFDGDMLLVVAAETAPDNPAARWQPYVSGEVVEYSLPCAHSDVAQPGMLAKVWNSISTWRK
jgi:thioesterase domain-containing protein